TTRPWVSGDAWRTIDATRSHRRIHTTRSVVLPSAHSASTTGSAYAIGECATPLAAVTAVVASVSVENGTPTARTMHLSASGCDGVRGHGTSRPIATSAANGIRNFIDAANHSAYRPCARFRRSASVNRPQTSRTTVDCQR